jgi:type I restriction enzyme M protein
MIGQFFTPEIVAECMFRLAGVRSGQRVIDPSCGDGSFLRTAPQGAELFGCEVDSKHAVAAKSFVTSGNFVEGDALTGLLKLWNTCDLVIGNPPFSAQANLEKRRNVLQGYDFGVGRKSQCFEVLFLELFLKLAKPNGKIAVILPDGPLSNKPFKYVRDWLLHRAHVEAIISLPRGIFSRTPAKTNILIAQRRPFSAQPYREPTFLLECKDLNELKPLRLAEWRKANPDWRRVMLADEEDWRPEAQNGSGGKQLTDSIRLGDVFHLRTGYALYAEKREFFDRPDDQRMLLIRAKNVAPEGGLRLDQNCAYISRSGEMFCDQSVVQPGEILFVRVGAGCYGRTALVPKRLAAQADDWIHVLTPLVQIDGEGVVEWFNSEVGRTEVRRLAKGVGTLSVSKSSLAELQLPARLVISNNSVPKPSSIVSKSKRPITENLIPLLKNDMDRTKRRRAEPA